MNRRALVLGACSVLGAAPAAAQSNPMRDGFFPREAAAPQAIVYETPVRGVRFVLDRSNPRQPLLRYDGAEEVLALSVTLGPRGDEFLKTDTGEVLLRVTALGGLTLYGPEGEQGAPAAVMGRARPLPGPSGGDGSPAAVQARIVGAARRGLDRRISVELVSSAPLGFVSDAARRVEVAIAQAGAGPRRRVAQRLRSVRFESARLAFAVLTEAGVLRIGLAPSLSYGGRPSSAAVRRALEEQARPAGR
jgi:hypothetical protein